MRRSEDRGPGQTVIGMGVAMAAGVLGVLARPAGADPLLTYPLKIKGHGARVEVAVTEEEKRTGLMFRRSLGREQRDDLRLRERGPLGDVDEEHLCAAVRGVHRPQRTHSQYRGHAAPHRGHATRPPARPSTPWR